MGQQQSHTKKVDIMQKYTFIKQITQGKNLYKHNSNKKQFKSTQRTFPNQQMLLEYQNKINHLIQLNHPYFLNQTQHAMIASSTLCSIQYRVVHLFQYQPHTLQQQLQTRKIHQRYFEPKQIWSILCSVVLAMAYLTKNNIQLYSLHPKDIVIDKFGMVKIISPLLADQTNHQIVQPKLYYSPQHLKSIKSQNFTQLNNKSSVFTLGITLLQILSLQPMNQLYNYQNFMINMDLLNQLIDKISQTQIKQVIKKMVKYHGYDRITFTQLEEMLYDVLEGQHDQHQQIDAHINPDNPSRLTTSIQKVYQTNDQRSDRQSNLISYRTGSSFSRQNQNEHTTSNIIPFMNDCQDTQNQLAYESIIDIQNIDEQDIGTKDQQTERTQLHQSSLTLNNSQQIYYSNSYQIGDSNVTRNALKQLHAQNNMTFSCNQIGKLGKHTQNKSYIPSIQLHKSHQQTSKPHHVRQVLKRGVYQGYKLNGARHGYGVFYYSEGGKYAGQWVQNKMQGRGALYYANQQIAYQGEWYNDKLHGYGILHNELPTYISQPFDYKTLHVVDNYWVKYEGNFSQDEKNGQGTIFLSNGQYYRGYFKDDLPHGNGIYKCMNGNLIKGNWILGMIH